MSFRARTSPRFNNSLDVPAPPVSTTLTISVSDASTVDDNSNSVIIANYVPSVSDSSTVTDTVQMQIVSFINVSDSSTVTDTVTIQEVSVISVSDASTVTDTVNIQEVDIINVSDSSTVTDTVTTPTVSYTPSVSDASTVTDTVNIQEVDIINVSDASTVTDTVALAINDTINVSDSSTVTDTVTLVITSFINVSDASTVTDTDKLQLVSFINVSDASTVTDTVNIQEVDQLSVSDASTVTDTVTMQEVSFINVSDASTVTDTDQMEMLSFINVSEASTVTDTVSLAISGGTLNVNVSDSSAVTDTVYLNVVNIESCELAVQAIVNDANLVSYWRFEGNSSDSKDSNTGTDTAVTYSPGNGLFNQGAGLNGTSSKIVITETTTLALTTFTLNAWVRTTANTGTYMVIMRRSGAFLQGYSFWLAPNTGIWEGYVGTGVDNNFSSGQVINDGYWHMITMTYDGTAQTLYTDGTNQVTQNIGSIVNSGALNIGFDVPNAGAFYKGAIDDLSIWSRVLSAAEVSNIYHCVNAGSKRAKMEPGFIIRQW